MKGYYIVPPCNTQAEEKNLKRVRRKIKNRQSAHDSRRRKKEYVDGLEERVERSTEANRVLQKKVSLLQEQNRTLIGQLRRLQKMVAQYNPSALQAGACVMVSVRSVVSVVWWEVCGVVY